MTLQGSILFKYASELEISVWIIFHIGRKKLILPNFVKMCSLLFYELALYRDNIESDQRYSV